SCVDNSAADAVFAARCLLLGLDGFQVGLHVGGYVCALVGVVDVNLGLAGFLALDHVDAAVFAQALGRQVFLIEHVVELDVLGHNLVRVLTQVDEVGQVVQRLQNCRGGGFQR